MPATDKPFYRQLVNKVTREYKRDMGYNLFKPAISVEFVDVPLASVGTDAAQATIHGIKIRTKESLYGRGDIHPLLYRAYLEYFPHEFAHVLLERWYDHANDANFHRKGWNLTHYTVYKDRSYMKQVPLVIKGKTETLDFPDLKRLITDAGTIQFPAPDGTGKFV